MLLAGAKISRPHRLPGLEELVFFVGRPCLLSLAETHWRPLKDFDANSWYSFGMYLVTRQSRRQSDRDPIPQLIRRQCLHGLSPARVHELDKSDSDCPWEISNSGKQARRHNDDFVDSVKGSCWVCRNCADYRSGFLYSCLADYHSYFLYGGSPTCYYFDYRAGLPCDYYWASLRDYRLCCPDAPYP